MSQETSQTPDAANKTGAGRKFKWSCDTYLAAWAGGQARVDRLGEARPSFSFCPASASALPFAEREKVTVKGRARSAAEAVRLVEQEIAKSGHTGRIEWKTRCYFVADLYDGRHFRPGLAGGYLEVDPETLRWLVSRYANDQLGSAESLTQAFSDAEAAAMRLISEHDAEEAARRNHIAATVRDPVSDVRAA